jgi:iron(III) transport system substrate-binding protein
MILNVVKVGEESFSSLRKGSFVQQNPTRRRLFAVLSRALPSVFLGAVVSALLPFSSGAYGQTQAAGGQASESAVVNVYSSRHYDVDKEINDAFTKATGIRVNVVSVKEAAQLVERMKAEGKRSPADVLMTVDVGNLQVAKSAGLFGKLKSSTVTDGVPAHLRDSDDEWTAVSFRARVIAYDKSKIKEGEITSYEDLADPKWKGRVLVRSSNHVYNQSLAASLVTALGEEKTESWARGVTQNLARKPEGGDTDQLKAIAAGRGQIAVVNSYYAGRLLASNTDEDKKTMQNIALLFPNQGDRGTHVNVSGVGLVKNAPHAAAARKYIDFWLSKESQSKIANAMFEFPAVVGVEPAPVVKAFGSPKFDTVPLSKVAANSPTAIRILDKAGWR